MVTFSNTFSSPQMSIRISHSLLSVPVIQFFFSFYQHSIYKPFHQYLIVFWAYLFYSAAPTQKQFCFFSQIFGTFKYFF